MSSAAPPPPSSEQEISFLHRYGLRIAVVLGALWLLNVPLVGLVVSVLNLLNGLGFTWPDGAGTFGDSYGAITSLFSLASFLAVLWAMHEQRKDSNVQIGLLKQELADAQLNQEIADLPFFDVTARIVSGVYDFEIRNIGSTVFMVEVEVSSPDRDGIESGLDPMINVGKADESPIIINGYCRIPSKIPVLAITYSLKSGRRLTEAVWGYGERPDHGRWPMYSRRDWQVDLLKGVKRWGPLIFK